jgi:hypothetical protein
MDYRLKPKRWMSCKESTEVEFMCAKLRPSEWKTLLGEWRIRVRFVTTRAEVLGELRTVVNDILMERYHRQTSLEKIDEHHDNRVRVSEEDSETIAESKISPPVGEDVVG